MTKKNNNNNTKILYIEDTKSEDASNQKRWLADEFGKINFKATSIMEDGGTTEAYIDKLKSMIQWADIIVFDYGGFGMMAAMGAGGAIIDYWNRFFISQIKDHPSKEWRCVSNLDTFDECEKDDLKQMGVKFR